MIPNRCRIGTSISEGGTMVDEDVCPQCGYCAKPLHRMEMTWELNEAHQIYRCVSKTGSSWHVKKIGDDWRRARSNADDWLPDLYPDYSSAMTACMQDEADVLFGKKECEPLPSPDQSTVQPEEGSCHCPGTCEGTAAAESTAPSGLGGWISTKVRQTLS